MPDREGSEHPQLYCRNCGTQAKQGNAFCVSCGGRLNVEGNAQPVIRGSGSRNRGLLDQRNTKVALYVTGLLLLLVVAYLLLSYSVPLGFLLIGLSVLAALVVRKTRGRQTRLEQRLFERVGQYKGSARKAYEEGKHREFAKNAYRQSREVYEEANTRYRRWSESQAAERERRARRSRFERYVSFFETAQDGSQSSLDWWRAYQDGGSDDAQPPISDLLRLALERSEAGLTKVRGMKKPLDRLLQEDSLGEADRLLEDVRKGQEDLDGEESVFSPLVAVHDRIKRLEGWANYREELEELVKDLEDLLDSPRVSTAAANRLRYPDPHGERRPLDLDETRSADFSLPTHEVNTYARSGAAGPPPALEQERWAESRRRMGNKLLLWALGSFLFSLPFTMKGDDSPLMVLALFFMILVPAFFVGMALLAYAMADSVYDGGKNLLMLLIGIWAATKNRK